MAKKYKHKILGRNLISSSPCEILISDNYYQVIFSKKTTYISRYFTRSKFSIFRSFFYLGFKIDKSH